MSSGITFSGVGSGLPVDEWIQQLYASEKAHTVDTLYTKKSTLSSTKTNLSSIESAFRSLKTAVQKFTDSSLASSFDIFASRTAVSSNTAVATVTADNNTPVQSVSLSVESLATSTKATSAYLSGSITGSELFTAVANKQGTLTSKHEDGTAYGKFSIYVNGSKKEISIEKTDTLDNIAKKINDSFDLNSDGDYSDNNVTASIADGKFSINYNNAAVTNLTLGSSSDTTNFFNIMQLSTASAVNNNNGTSSFTSLSNISKINLSGKIIGNEANLNVDELDPITAGTVKIGGAEFTVDENTTLSSLMSKINSSTDAGVRAQIDTKTNKLVLISKTEGKTAVNLEDGTSNFLTKIGLITAGGDSIASQTLGTNARVYINGSTTALEVNSNKLTGDVSGISGVTINLKKTTAVTGNNTTTDEPININVDQNSDQITGAVNDFISKYNTLVSDVNTKTAKDQALHGEYTLVNIKNSLRTMTLNRVSGLSDYDNLAIIGISTGAVGKSASNTSNNLQLDSKKLLDALQKNPAEVKALFVGDSTTGVKGVFQKLEDKLESILDPVNGYFESRSNSIDASIATNDKAITKGENRLAAYKTLITRQFSSMDSYINQMQQQSQSLSSISSVS